MVGWLERRGRDCKGEGAEDPPRSIRYRPGDGRVTPGGGPPYDAHHKVFVGEVPYIQPARDTRTVVARPRGVEVPGRTRRLSRLFDRFLRRRLLAGDGARDVTDERSSSSAHYAIIGGVQTEQYPTHSEEEDTYESNGCGPSHVHPFPTKLIPQSISLRSRRSTTSIVSPISPFANTAV